MSNRTRGTMVRPIPTEKLAEAVANHNEWDVAEIKLDAVWLIDRGEREYPELVVKDLLERAAHEIGKHENIPSQIKIDRAPVGQGEKITVTWFA